MNSLQKIILLVISLIPLWSYAHYVPENRAKEIAVNLLQHSRQSRSSAISLQMVYNGLENGTRSSHQPPYFVFNNSAGKGFVIVAAEDAVMPVLGYSTDHNFTIQSLPVSVSGWLADLAEQVLSVRERDIKPSPSVMAAWSRMMAQGPSDPVVKLETAEWDQRDPYNRDCFMIDGRHALTGCVATATAIVMRYHQWPDIGEGTLPSYTFDGYTVPSREFKPYDWNSMPLEYTRSATETQKAAVAQLMSDCGVMFRSIYRLNGTEAYTADVPMYIGRFMKYDKGARFLLRDDYSDSEWNRLLQENLHECGPIIYKGTGSAGGHSFVVDGYSSDGFYSVNWGWGGKYNGFYLLDAMEPNHNIHLNKEQGAVLGIRKDAGGTFKEEISFKKMTSDDSPGIQSSTASFVQNIPFDLTVQGLVNTGSVMFESVDFLLALTNEQGEIKQELGQWNVQTLRAQYAADVYKGTFTIKCDILAGDRIRLFYRARKGDWNLVKGVEGQHIAWEILVMDKEVEPEPIGQCVSLQFDRQTKLLELNVQNDIHVTMCNLKGEDLSSLIVVRGNVHTIDTDQLLLDTYVLRFLRGDESMEVQIVVGRDYTTSGGSNRRK